MSLIDHNGTIVDAATNIVNAENRAFNYGDSIFETMQVKDEKIMFWDDHFQRLTGALAMLQMKLPDHVDKQFLHERCIQLAEKNNCSVSARIKINIFREGEGRYTPEGSQASYVIKAYPRTKPLESEYIDNLTITLFEGIMKPNHPSSNYKTGSSLTYILAGLHAKENGFDDALITNADDYIVDAVYSSAFIVKDGTVKTSPVEIGCIDGVMRRQVIKVCEDLKIPVEIIPIGPEDVSAADELFLTNTSQLLKSAKSYNSSEKVSVIGKQIFKGLLRLFFA